MKDSDQDKADVQSQRMKKCPECQSYIQIDATVCDMCHSKVGAIGVGGIAKKPLNLRPYISCLVVWAMFGFYIWWVFIRDK